MWISDITARKVKRKDEIKLLVNHITRCHMHFAERPHSAHMKWLDAACFSTWDIDVK